MTNTLNPLLFPLIFLAGLGFGILVAVIWKNKELSSSREKLREIETRLELEREKILEQESFLAAANHTLRDSFSALSKEALEKNSESLLQVAKLQLEKFQETAKGDLELRHQSIADLVRPVKESLEKVDVKLAEVEKSRVGDFSKMQEQISRLVFSESELRQETSKLVNALRRPNVRGRWGEIQLKRVVEIAGMLNYCDFFEQETMHGEGEKLRPDMVIRLPGEREVVIDSKVPLQAFLDAIEQTDEALRESRLRSHADYVRQHVVQLGSKSYWERLKRTPEFVVLFLPSESFFSSALEIDPSLIEFAATKRVVLATPTTLISLLQAVSVGWREEQLAKNTKEVQRIGRDFYEKADVLARHFHSLRKGIDSVVKSYNDAAGSFETRFLGAARKFKELGVPTGSEIEELTSIDRAPRELRVIPEGEGTLEAAES